MAGNMSSGEDVEVPRDPVEFLAGDVRGEDELVAVFDEGLLEEVLDDVAHPSPVGVPEDQAGADLLLDGEEVEALAEDAVVALLRLLEAVEVGPEVLTGEERGAVDPLEHLAAFVAAPVCAGRAEQPVVLQSPGAGNVGPPAKVQEGAVPVDGDDFVRGELLEALELEGVVGEEVSGLVPGHDPALEGMIGAGDFVHALLDGLQLLGREGLRDLEIVVEAVVDGRSEADSGTRHQLADGGGENMRGRVAQDAERLRIALGEQPDPGPVAERAGEVHHFAVRHGGEGGAGESRPDPGGQIGGRGSGGKGDGAPVGQSDRDGVVHACKANRLSGGTDG